MATIDAGCPRLCCIGKKRVEGREITKDGEGDGESKKIGLELELICNSMQSHKLIWSVANAQFSSLGNSDSDDKCFSGYSA